MGQSRVSILVIQGLTIAVLREMKRCLYWTTFQAEGFHCIYIMLFGFVTENAGFEDTLISIWCFLGVGGDVKPTLVLSLPHFHVVPRTKDHTVDMEHLLGEKVQEPSANCLLVFVIAQ